MRGDVYATLLFACPLAAQYVPPGQQTTGCPLRNVDARIKTISPQGQLTLDAKGELVIGQITSETRYQIPGYSGGGDITQFSAHDIWLMGLLRVRAESSKA